MGRWTGQRLFLPMRVLIDGVAHSVGADGSEDVGGWLHSDWYVVMFHGIGTINDGWWPISVPEFSRQMAELAKHRGDGAVEIVTLGKAQSVSARKYAAYPLFFL